MSKKDKIIWMVLGGIVLAITIGLICFFSIPRIDYNYDKKEDCYYVNKAYGNSKSYDILDEIDGKKVVYIDEKAFMDKTKLETIKMGKNITIIERLAFSNCVNLSDIDLSNIAVIERNAFMDCKSLESVFLNAKDIYGGAFYDCSSLSKVTLNNTVTIGSFAFTGTVISEIVLPNTLYTLGVDAFYNCNYLSRIECHSNVLRSNEYLLSLGSIVIFK